MRRIVIAARVVALSACGLALGPSAADAEELAVEPHAAGVEPAVFW